MALLVCSKWLLKLRIGSANIHLQAKPVICMHVMVNVRKYK